MTRGKGKILLIDDDPDIRIILRDILLFEGYDVIEARDGQEGVDKFKQEPTGIKLVVTDIVMPNKNGISCFTEIKSINPKMRTLFMSGYHHESIPYGCEILFKPFAPNDFINAVRKCILA